MPRLPIPGADANSWGDILNSYLQQSHDSNGDLRSNSVTEAQIDAATPTSGQVLGFNGTSLNWTTPTSSGSVPDADTVTKGLVRLNGDLAGTASSPSVAKIKGVAIASNTAVAGQVLMASSSSAAAWTNPAASMYISVKDHGALGDGTTDDVAAIQAAINAGNTAGGATIFFPRGVYIVGSTFTIYSNIRLLGEGITTSTIKLKNGANTTIFQTYQFNSLTGGTSQGGPTHFGWEHLTFDANKANNTTSMVAKIYGSSYSAHHFEAINGATGGILSEWGTGGTDMEAHWSDFKIHECLGTSLDWRGPHDSTFMLGEVFSLNGRIDTAIRTSGNAVGEKFIGTHTWGSLNYGYKFETIAFAFDSTAEGARSINVWFLTGHCRWSGGQIYGANNSGEVGLQYGDSTHGINGSLVDNIEMFNFFSNGTLINFSNTFGSNYMRATIRQNTAPSLYIGVPDATDRIEIMVADIPANSINFIPGTNSIRGNTTYSGTQFISPGAVNQAYTVRAPGQDIFNVNTTAKWIEFPNSSQMYFYSGAYSGLTMRIKGSDGTIFWGASGDTTLYRGGVAVLASNARLAPTDSITLKSKSGVPLDADFASPPPDGTLAYNSLNGYMYIRSGGSWQTITAGGGGGSTTLAALTDVSAATPTNGQALVYNSSLAKWVNSTPSVATGNTAGVTVPIQYATPLAANEVYTSDPINALDPTVFGRNPAGTYQMQIRCTQSLSATLSCSPTGQVGTFTSIAVVTPTSYAGALMASSTGAIPQDMPYLQLVVTNGTTVQTAPFNIYVGVVAGPTNT